MPCSSHSFLMLSGHMLACISPICAFFRYSIHRRDCPIPPPMLSGSEPFRSLLWKYNSFRSSFPESSNWRNSASLSTRIPIDESSMARPSTSFHTRRSPLSPGSPRINSGIIIVVRSTKVVWLSVAQIASYTNYKYCTVLLSYQVFTFFWSLVWIHLQEFL